MTLEEFIGLQAQYLALGQVVLDARERVRQSLMQFDYYPRKPRAEYDRLIAQLVAAEDAFLPVRERYWEVVQRGVPTKERKDGV